MEFSYRITEAEYARAWNLRRVGLGKNSKVKTVMFWFFILICITLLWAVVQKGNPVRSGSRTAPAPTVSQSGEAATEPGGSRNHAPTGEALLFNVGPFVVLIVVWVIMVSRLGPISLLRLYRKDPQMQGLFTVNITPESISMRNTAGSNSQSGWSIYERWIDGKDLIVLVLLSQAFFVVSLAGLQDVQRGELRSILSTALPKK
jgi:hypothetical protein